MHTGTVCKSSFSTQDPGVILAQVALADSDEVTAASAARRGMVRLCATDVAPAWAGIGAGWALVD